MSSINFENGESVLYNGKDAVVVCTYSLSNNITIRVDGDEEITVNKNDLFGMNEKKNYFEERIAKCDKEIENNWLIINKAKAVHSEARNLITKLRKKMNSILSAFHATTVNQITDEAQRREYLAFREQKSDAVTAKNRATHEICLAAIDTGTVCFTKNGLINQALSEYFA